MKNLIVVFGYGANNEAHNKNVIYLLSKDLNDDGRKKIQIKHLEDSDPESALGEIRNCISRMHEKNKEEVIVAYSGENLYLFKHRLASKNFDLLNLRKKIDEAVSDDECSSQRTEMVDELFVGGILRLLKAD